MCICVCFGWGFGWYVEVRCVYSFVQVYMHVYGCIHKHNAYCWLIPSHYLPHPPTHTTPPPPFQHPQRVQHAAIAAATTSVQNHFRHLCDVYTDFTQRHAAQSTTHTNALTEFDHDLHSLANQPLLPSVCTPEHRVLLDLLPEQRLRVWADYCRRSHTQFIDKVRELDRIHTVLCRDVESLLAHPPGGRPSLEELVTQERHVRGLLDEQTAIVNTLSSDFGSVQAKVEAWARILALSSAASAGGGVDMEELRGMEEINCVHLSELLPRVREVAGEADALAHAAVQSKVWLWWWGWWVGGGGMWGACVSMC